MELDENFKRLVKELGHAINETIADSERISEIMGCIRASGYDLFLVLEVTVGFNRRNETSLARRPKSTPQRTQSQETEFRLNNHDTQFLRALKISVDEEES